MKLTQTLLNVATLSCSISIASAQTVNFDFENNTVTGGTLILQPAGTDPVDSFLGDRFDQQFNANFQITGIGGAIGTLNGTASALFDDLNVTASGLADAGSGYNGTGEGTSFVFDEDIVVTGLDFTSFTSEGGDSVTLLSGITSIGTFEDGEIIGSTNFFDPNAVTASIFVAAGDAFTIEYAAGAYHLGDFTFTVVPEPGTYALLSGFCALGFVMLRRRKS